MPNSPYKSPETENDLREIWRYIANDSVTAADAMVDRIEKAFDMLAMYPNSGRARPELAPGLRSFPSDSYIVFYLIAANGIEVMRVIHAHRDIIPKDMPSPRLT